MAEIETLLLLLKTQLEVASANKKVENQSQAVMRVKRTMEKRTSSLQDENEILRRQMQEQQKQMEYLRQLVLQQNQDLSRMMITQAKLEDDLQFETMENRELNRL